MEFEKRPDEMSPEELKDLCQAKIKFGETLLTSIENIKAIDGYQKLSQKINQDLKFLRKVYKNNSIKKEYLQCSNLTHFSALINTIRTVTNCQSVITTFLLENRKIIVDIISDEGLTWTKVIAKNPKSISDICMGNASYGVRSIIDQAEEFIECAGQNPWLFQTPKIVFVFTKGISNKIATKLESLGIIVEGERLSDVIKFNSSSDISDTECDTDRINITSSTMNLSTKNVENFTKVNLDVSAMLAYCSSVTNGSAILYDFDVPVLKQQAEWERLRPQKPLLEAFFQRKKLYCCQTARDNFVNIIETVGGPQEKVRAEELLQRVSVLPDDADFSSTDEDKSFQDIFGKAQYTDEKLLQVGGKIKKRSLIIFTFGDRIQAVTVTANDGFVRAARQQGIHFVVFIHESRALTEHKERMKAFPLNK